MATVVHPAGNVDFDSQAVNTGDILEIREGSQVIDTDLNRGSDQLNGFRVLPNFHGQLGTPSTPATVRVDNGSNPTVLLASSGNAIYLAAHTTGGVTRLDVRVASGEVHLAGTGTFATVNVYSGTVYIGAGAVVTNLNVYGGVVYQVYNATANTTVSLRGGQLTTRRVGTTITAESGTLILQEAAASTALTARGNAVINHRSTGTVTTLTLDGSATLTPSMALTDPIITTLNLNSPNVRYYLVGPGGVRFAVGTTNNNGGASIFDESAAVIPV